MKCLYASKISTSIIKSTNITSLVFFPPSDNTNTCNNTKTTASVKTAAAVAKTASDAAKTTVSYTGMIRA